MSLLRDLQRLPWLFKLNLILLGLVLVAISAMLWPHWQRNPDLSHGFFMPVLFLLLLSESRNHGKPRYLTLRPLHAFIITGMLFIGLIALVAAGLYSASVGWSHALVAFSLTGAVTLFFAAALLILSDKSVRLIPFNWTSIVAIGLWLLCAPIPPGTYSRLTVSLQLSVSQHVLSALHLLGVAASRHGNIIELANTSVGVEEACSGIRSLISCIFAGFFFSATLVRRPWSRVLIVLLAAPIALVMNFVRSLILTLLANRGVDISGTWHDATGFAVLGVTAAILGGLALLLDNTKQSPRVVDTQPGSFAVPRFIQASLSMGLIIAAVLSAFFYLNTRPSTASQRPVPDLLAILPAASPGWHVDTAQDLYQFSGVLQTNNLAQRTYLKVVNGREVQITVYLAYWKSGQSSVSEVAMHTPDACWPGSGWEVAPIATPRERLSLNGELLPSAESRKFFSGNFPQYVWFWHLYDGRSISYDDPYSPVELLKLAWRFGFSHHGEQMFVRVSSNQSWDSIQDEPLLAEIFKGLVPLGL